MTDRTGRFMATYTGGQFWPLDPRPEDIKIEDIAHSLSMQCRYNGHSRFFYSVAEHCVHVSNSVPAQHALWGLLHDATEAYVGDMIRPLKADMPAFVEAENKVMAAICERFGLEPNMPASVHEADGRIITDERAAVMTATDHVWATDALEPLDVIIRCWGPVVAEKRYLDRFRELTA